MTVADLKDAFRPHRPPILTRQTTAHPFVSHKTPDQLREVLALPPLVTTALSPLGSPELKTPTERPSPWHTHSELIMTDAEKSRVSRVPLTC
jgi:hypothetical protein